MMTCSNPGNPTGLSINPGLIIITFYLVAFLSGRGERRFRLTLRAEGA